MLKVGELFLIKKGLLNVNVDFHSNQRLKTIIYINTALKRYANLDKESI